jgi:hypothetical protein
MRHRRPSVLVRRCVAPAIAALAAGLLPCACTKYCPIVTRPPTLGEELIQLDAARRDGLLTQEEHDRRRTETIAAWKRIGDAPIEPPAPAAGGPGTPSGAPTGSTK